MRNTRLNEHTEHGYLKHTSWHRINLNLWSQCLNNFTLRLSAIWHCPFHCTVEWNKNYFLGSHFLKNLTFLISTKLNSSTFTLIYSLAVGTWFDQFFLQLVSFACGRVCVKLCCGRVLWSLEISQHVIHASCEDLPESGKCTNICWIIPIFLDAAFVPSTN